MMWVSFPGGHDRSSAAQRRRKFAHHLHQLKPSRARWKSAPPLARVSTASCCASRLNSAIANGPWSRPPSVRRMLAFSGGEEFRHVRRVARQTPRSRTGAVREDARDTIIALGNRGAGKTHAGARSSGLSPSANSGAAFRSAPFDEWASVFGNQRLTGASPTLAIFWS
jgi:hypothetical protein